MSLIVMLASCFYLNAQPILYCTTPGLNNVGTITKIDVGASTMEAVFYFQMFENPNNFNGQLSCAECYHR